MSPTPTPEQLSAAEQRALFLQMTQNGYSGAVPAEVRDALLKQSVEARFIEMEKQMLSLQKELKELVDDRDKALRRGIVALGMAVLGMGTWIVNLFTAGHIK